MNSLFSKADRQTTQLSQDLAKLRETSASDANYATIQGKTDKIDRLMVI